MPIRGPIVIIEDDHDDQFFYEQALQKLRVLNPVIFFSNGREALEYLKKPNANPFLILSDINMPLMSGLELRELMCKHEPLAKKNTPFIFMSTSAQPADINKAKELYIQGFFKKESDVRRHENMLNLIINYWANCRLNEN